MYANDAYLGRWISVGGGSDVIAGVHAGTLSLHIRLDSFGYHPLRSSLLPTISEARHSDGTFYVFGLNQAVLS